MSLPEELQQAIELELAGKSLKQIAGNRQALSQQYRSGSEFKMDSHGMRLSYLTCRMPATFAAITSVLKELPTYATIESLLDLGAGPGTVFWAATHLLPSLKKATLIEQDEGFVELGKNLAKKECPFKPDWALQNMNDLHTVFQPHDLVMLSYSLGELSPEERRAVIQKAWNATQKFLICIEPGTPRGFEVIREARKQLIAEQAHLTAPCPHQKACPMSGEDWCHFSVRLERSRLHRQVKEAELGYEDEKYSYVIFSRTPVKLPEARVLRHPKKHSGHMEFYLCTDQGLENRTISKRHGDLYKIAKKLTWGSILSLFLLFGCSEEQPKGQLQAEYVYRKHDEILFPMPEPQPKSHEPYPWEDGVVGNFPKITKEYFRCKGSTLNPPKSVEQGGEMVRLYDCGGGQKHSLPMREGKEFIYPILMDLLNYVQSKTNKKVVITSGHRCPDHNTYVDPSVYNQSSKHMIAAEVCFYVQGLEDKPEAIVKWIMDYYAKNPKYQNAKEFLEFKRYENEDTDVSTQPWYNKEVFVKLYKKKEGRDYDNRHPYPYISVQVRYDRDKQEKVIYTWIKANREFMRY